MFARPIIPAAALAIGLPIELFAQDFRFRGTAAMHEPDGTRRAVQKESIGR
jgi:hypothetical protein